MLNSEDADLSPPGQMTLEPCGFVDLDGWLDDDHNAAWAAFVRTCGKLSASTDETGIADQQLAAICLRALDLGVSPGRAAAQQFFERFFTPHRILHSGQDGVLTGYYEPVLKGSRVRTDRFRVPVLRQPDDLLKLSDDRMRGSLDGQLTAGRRDGDQVVAYFTRAEIENGVLDGFGLELVFLASEVDAFFLHVQGSGRVELPDGEVIRIGYAAKNGHPYTSIGKILIERGDAQAGEMSLEFLRKWLEAEPGRGRAVMQCNRSYIFFRELNNCHPGDGALGAAGVPLTEGRSLAVDAGLVRLGLPVFVVAPTLDVHEDKGFRRLMVAQDVGSAIKGPERGDIYWGVGPVGEHLAGNTNHRGNMFVLLPADGG